MNAIERKFLRSLKSFGLHRNEVCLVALSGGGDSMALLDLMYRVSGTCRIKVHAARVVHGLRSNEEEEAENRLCETACRQRSIDFKILRSSDGPSLKKQPRRGVEQAARTFRKSLLDNRAREIHASRIFYGHNADDRLETILMRLLSGSGPEGLSGIPAVSGLICRPLLAFSRQELRTHLEERGIPWAEDRSNSSSDFLRNRIRIELLPLIEDIYPGWKASLSVLGERSEEASESLNRTSEAELPMVPVPGPRMAYGWEDADWGNASEYSRALALWKAFKGLDHSGIPDRRFPWRALRAAREAVNRRRIWKSPEMSLTRRDGKIIAERPDTPEISLRIVLKKEDVDPVFSAVLGGTLIRVANCEVQGAEKKENRTVVTSWPLVIEYCGTSAVPSVQSRAESNDVAGDLVYISICTAEEGNDAR